MLTQGGVYLARLDPAKKEEIGKLRPVVILTSEILLTDAPIVFICPLSSQSHRLFSPFHIELSPRDNLHVTSFALVEHCRAIASKRLATTRIAQLSKNEIKLIRNTLHLMLS